MGIVRWEPLFRQALRANLGTTFVPSLRDRPNDLDCDQYHSRDQPTHDAHPEYENSTLKSSSPPKQPDELMPTAVHAVSNSESRGC